MKILTSSLAIALSLSHMGLQASPVKTYFPHKPAPARFVSVFQALYSSPGANPYRSQGAMTAFVDRLGAGLGDAERLAVILGPAYQKLVESEPSLAEQFENAPSAGVELLADDQAKARIGDLISKAQTEAEKEMRESASRIGEAMKAGLAQVSFDEASAAFAEMSQLLAAFGGQARAALLESETAYIEARLERGKALLGPSEPAQAGEPRRQSTVGTAKAGAPSAGDIPAVEAFLARSAKPRYEEVSSVALFTDGVAKLKQTPPDLEGRKMIAAAAERGHGSAQMEMAKLMLAISKGLRGKGQAEEAETMLARAYIWYLRAKKQNAASLVYETQFNDLNPAAKEAILQELQ
ncbi:MAG: hypothetical protein HY549_08640 [Elusimicrobia bacterium]|nr:hypothetical protein [Elusimicrobiota bacterium]